MGSSRLTFRITSPRFRLKKWNSLPWGTLFLHSPPHSSPKTRRLRRKSHSTRPRKWVLVSSTDLHFHSTSELFLNQPPFILANNLRLLILPPLICIDTTVVPAITPVQIQTPLWIPASAGAVAARNVGSSSNLCFSSAPLVITLLFLRRVLPFVIRVVLCCWE